MIKLKIDVKKINKDYLFRGEKGIYLDAALFDKPNEFGDDGFIVQDLPKKIREEDPEARGPIIGNWRDWEAKAAPPKRKFPKPSALEEGEIPW